VVAAYTYVVARLELGATLADKVRATEHYLAVPDLYTEHLRLAIAPVARRAYSLFVCHLFLPFRRILNS
jgi:hypothetical protein